MRAAAYFGVGGPEVLNIIDNAPVPKLAQGEVLVRVACVSINPLDTKIRTGFIPGFVIRMGGAKWPPAAGSPKPFIPGADFSGVVETPLPSGGRFRKGDRVCSFRIEFGTGSLAEFVACKESDLALIPASIKMEDAAAMPMVGLTAWQGLALVKGAAAKPGALVLINGGAGGVGSMAVQIAAARGMTVTATCAARNAARVQAMGAVATVDYASTPDFQAFAAERGGMDVIYDTVGGGVPSSVPLSKALKTGGHYLRLMTEVKLRLILDFVKARFFGLFGGPSYSLVFAAVNGSQLADIMKLMAEGKVRMAVDRSFPLSLAAAAFRHAEEGRPVGKVIVVVDPNIA